MSKVSTAKRSVGRPTLDYERKRLNLKVPVMIREKMERIAMAKDQTKTESFIAMIQKLNKKLQSEQPEKSLNHDRNQFIQQYKEKNSEKFEHDYEQANSDALDAFYQQEGYAFGNEEESFILPKI